MSLLSQLKKKRQQESTTEILDTIRHSTENTSNDTYNTNNDTFSSNEISNAFENMTLDTTFEEKTDLTMDTVEISEVDIFAQADYIKELSSGKQHSLQVDILQKFRKWKLSENDTTIENTCIKKSTILIPTIYQDFLRNYYKNYKNKGILLYNTVGSGKTFSSILMAIEGLKIGMYKKVVVLLPGSLRVNYQDHIKEYQNAFTILAYNNIYIKSKLPDLNDTLVIIDECQNLTSMITNGSSIGIYLYKKINEANCRIIAMSATPIINNSYEYVSLFNLLKKGTFKFDMPRWNHTFYEDDTSRMKNKKKFYDSINGLVSYYQGANDKSVIFPTHQINIVKLNMSTFQANGYREIRKTELDKKKNNNKRKYVNEITIITGITQGLGDFKVKSRQACNFIYPNGKLFASQLTKEDLVDNLQHYSIKFAAIIDSIKNCDGTVMVYSSFIENSLNVLKYAMEYHGISNTMWIGGLSDEQRRKILYNFNHPDNHNGSRIKVIMVSLAGAEGISLKNVQQIHIIEPHWNEIKIKQIIGRAIRICSHYTLPKNKQNVKVFRYITQIENEETTDEAVFDISQQKYASDREFDKLIKSSAIDCLLNKKQNTDVDTCFEEILV